MMRFLLLFIILSVIVVVVIVVRFNGFSLERMLVGILFVQQRQ